MFDRRDFLGAAAAATLAPASATLVPVLRPEDFGAAGDGMSDDTAAFTELSVRLNRAGGGTLALGQGRTYLLGQQRRGHPEAYSPEPLLNLHELGRPLVIEGNGARLRAASGLRYGSFDPITGAAVHRALPNTDRSLVASPYKAMLSVVDCTAPVLIRNLELDGNCQMVVLGGRWGDAGWQVPGSGLYLSGNVAAETLHNIYVHHQPLDGAIISGKLERTSRSQINRLVCRFNGRQGLSFLGGQGYDFIDCEFAHTGRSRLASPPGAGVDLEAEDNRIRDLSFSKCRFIDNTGAGLVADSGDTAAVHFRECHFVGTTNWSAWPRKPAFQFTRCTFAGAVVHACSNSDARIATSFADCLFTDDTALSPTGHLYFSGGATGPVVDLDASDNVLFNRCRFELQGAGVLPWTTRAIYRDCMMEQHSREIAMTKGRYLGHNVIKGPVDLYGSMIVGQVYLNGRLIPEGRFGTGFAPW